MRAFHFAVRTPGSGARLELPVDLSELTTWERVTLLSSIGRALEVRDKIEVAYTPKMPVDVERYPAVVLSSEQKSDDAEREWQERRLRAWEDAGCPPAPPAQNTDTKPNVKEDGP